MKTIIKNENNLKESDITINTKKVKLLLINSNDELLLGYSHHEYQFPGGTNEPNEELIDTINREIEEETGMQLNLQSIEPFAGMIGYYKDWPKEGENKKVEIYYYEVRTDEKPNLDNLNLTDNEKDGNFELRLIKLENVIDELEKNSREFGDPHGIANEMINLLSLYMGLDDK